MLRKTKYPVLADVEALMPRVDMRLSEFAPDKDGAIVSLQRHEASVAMQVNEDKNYKRTLEIELRSACRIADGARWAAEMEKKAKVLAKDPVHQVKKAAALLPDTRAYVDYDAPMFNLGWASHGHHYDPGLRYGATHVSGGTRWFR